MTRFRSIQAVALTFLFLLAGSSGSLRADQTSPDWLRSTGKELEICLKGEVFESDGRAATDLRVTGGLFTAGVDHPLVPTIEGHRFRVWIPVNQVKWYSLWLKATSVGEDRVACKRLHAYELRQAAVDGITMTLQSPTRWVDVKVLDGACPVPDAVVEATLDSRIALRSRTDARGIARFGLLPQQTLFGLTAWTDDFRIGGFWFFREPTRDPKADEHVVELNKCRDQKLRFVDESGAPVAGLEFVLHVATAGPTSKPIGTNEHFRMTTGAAGEVTCRWVPDWDKHDLYAVLNSDHWMIDGDNETIDGVTVFKLKKRKPRKRVQGRLVSTATGVGGFYVKLLSRQGEREGRGDALYAFTDSNGTFAMDVQPDATYCAYAMDSRWVSEIIDLIPYQSASDKITAPELSVSKGEEVEVIVTSGPQKKPYPNLEIGFHWEYRYTCRVDGRTRRVVDGPGWYVATDESGRATTRSLPGKLKVSVNTPLWRTEETVEVRSGEVATLQLHREAEEKRKVTGRLVLAEGLSANLADAEIRIGAVDGNFDDQQTLKARKDGAISFETPATAVGIFGHTLDGQAAGACVVTNLDRRVDLHLRPTMDYHGQLLGEGDQPLVGHRVVAVVRVEGDEDYNGSFQKSFEAKRIEAKTDEQGTFTLRGLPSRMKLFIRTDAINGSKHGSVYLADVYLEPNESRPRVVSRLASPLKSTREAPLADRFQSILRDCSLSGYHAMVITLSDRDEASEFVNRCFVDFESNEDVAAYMPIVVSRDRKSLPTADAAFLQERKWQLPGERRVCAYAVDAQGNELGRVELDMTDKNAAETAATFVHRHAPRRVDAEKKWQEAFAEAKRSNRRVWARISGRYCGPCFRMTRWLDDQREILEKDYVMLKIDGDRDENGPRVAQRLTHGKHHGIPFHAILDADETMRIDSVGPIGNVGYPSGYEGKKQLRKMLQATRQHLTNAEIDRLVESLGD